MVALVAGAGLALAAVPAAAQQTCVLPDPIVEPRQWQPPLGRTVTLHTRTITLRTALDRVASAAHVRLSYSPDLLPLDRFVCLSYESAAVGTVLAGLLAGTTLAAVVAGTEHIILAPTVRPARSAAADLPFPILRLEPVVVNSIRSPSVEIPAAASMSVLDGHQLALDGSNTLAEAFNGSVAGVWVWQPAAASLGVQYGSLRGASSFGLSYPKVYIDGIELANPLLAGRFSPEAVERIELIRGPESGALYGADALSGVTNIISRNVAEAFGAPRTTIRSGFGVTASRFNGAAVAQQHTVSMRFGTPASSVGLTVSGGSTGELVPNGYDRHLTANGSARFEREHSLITGSLRFVTQRAAQNASPLLGDSLAALRTPLNSKPQSVQQYTVGLKAEFTPDQDWTHTLILGVDGYALDNVPDEWTPLLSPTDSALRAVAGGVRGTLRFSSGRRFELGRYGHAGLTFMAERSELRQRSAIEENIVLGSSPPTTGQNGYLPQVPIGTGALTTASLATRAQSNTGLATQLKATLFNRLSLSGGVRFEHEAESNPSNRFATLPSLSGALVTGQGPLSVKLHAAYGKGIRWPQAQAPVSSVRERLQARRLKPEEQSGLEAGIDVTVGPAFSLGITRFDQTASNLIQRTALSDTQATFWSGTPRIALELQNVGEITNRGWELQARLARGPFALAGALSLVDSRVQKVAENYDGDLRPGDRMLAVPASTVSLTASWQAAGWYTSWTAYRASDWLNYDRIALAHALLDDDTTEPILGDQLRAFWRKYDGSVHLRMTTQRDLGRGLTLTLSGDNLFNRQLGEPDNATIIPGRTVTLGLRASF
ncbi:MAG TPA: TonB-dependent receptor [Longimicrobiales bacterium]|nr:TonB-dependent receptor [Longimicrobiales bacterium]